MIVFLHHRRFIAYQLPPIDLFRCAPMSVASQLKSDVSRLLHLLVISMILSSNVISISCAANEEPRIQLAVDSDEVFVGEAITLQVIVHNVESPDTPNLSALEEDFRYELQATQPMSSSSVVIVNGRMTTQQEFKTVFQYELFPNKPGSLTIPPIKVVANGKEISSQPLIVRIAQPEPQEFVLAEIHVNPASVYPTQSFEVALQVLVRALPESERDPLQPLRRDPPSLTIPWIESHDGFKGPEDISRWLGSLKSNNGYGFSLNNYRSNDPFDFGFGRPSLALFGLENGVVDRVLSDGTTAKFFRYELIMKFQATRSGQFSFGPASVKGTFVTESSGREYRGKKIAVTASPAIVDVKNIPDVRPEQFMGGIGRFQATASVSPSQARVGDPMTLTLTFSSAEPASLDLVAAPDLRQAESLSKDFEIIDNAPVGRIEGTNKLFTYGIRPNKKREEIPGLTFFSFDPQTEQFIELRTSSIPIQMQEGASLSTQEIVGSNNERRPSLKADRSGIFQGTADMYPLTDDSLVVSRWVGAAGLSWIFSLAGAWYLRTRSAVSKSSPAQRLTQASASARDQLGQARALLSAGNLAAARTRVRQSLVGLVAAASDRSIDGLTTQNVIDQLNIPTFDSSKLKQLKQILENIDASQYGGANHQELLSDLDQAEGLIEPLTQALKSISKTGLRKARLIALSITVAVGWMPAQAIGDSAQSQAQASFESAMQAMNSAQTPDQFAEVARQLDSLEANGVRSGSLHFHAGNAWFRAGEYGRAIRQYRFAKFYLPNDAYLNSNLEQAMSMAPGKVTEQPSESLSDKIIFWTNWLAYASKIRFASIAMILSSACVLLCVWRRDRRFLFGTLVLALTASGLYLDAYVHSPHAYAATRGVICAETTARKGMGIDYPAAFDRPLKDGAEFEVLQRTPNWTLARFPEVGDGWVDNMAIANSAQ